MTTFKVGTGAGFTVGTTAQIGIKNYVVPGTGIGGKSNRVILPVRSSVAPLLLWAARDWNKLLEPLRPGWCWGYAHRQVTGGTGWSWHAAGIAIDLNAPLHPYGADTTFTAYQLAIGNAIAAKYGLRWGQNYQSNKDGMHLEVILTPEQAKKRIAELKRKPGSVIAFPKGGLERGDRGFEVRVLQRALVHRPLPTNPRVDGVFGPKTEQAVKEYERRAGLRVDGRVGRKVWEGLL